jgi:serine/threonine protein kinase
MELLEGRTLSELQREGRPPLDDALRYAIQVVDALDHAHGRGVVHRDLKSSNVVIEPGGRAIVLDFGRRSPWIGESRLRCGWSSSDASRRNQGKDINAPATCGRHWKLFSFTMIRKGNGHQAHPKSRDGEG